MKNFLLFISLTVLTASCQSPKEKISNMLEFQTQKLRVEYDYLAPDGSEIRLLQSMNHGGLAHCSLPPGEVSAAVRHKTVEEIWYFIEGNGEVWRKQGEKEEVVLVEPGVSLTIPVGTHFQFRNTGSKPLKFLICTMPPWPGEEEAVKVKDYW
jgi:mannose-6-phosphate isomerase-like protein (cupin superfamily)